MIPPAWSDVWICPSANGHIQAVGTDARGRRQYRYHDAWRPRRDAAKHDRVPEVATRLPGARATVAEHLRPCTSYIDPRVVDLFADGLTIGPALERLGDGGAFGQPATHGQVEAAVLRLLQRPGDARDRRTTNRTAGRLARSAPANSASPARRSGGGAAA